MQKKIDRVFVDIFIIFLFVFLFSILAGKIFAKQITEFERKNSEFNSDTIEIDWEKLYPYDLNIETGGGGKS